MKNFIFKTKQNHLLQISMNEWHNNLTLPVFQGVFSGTYDDEDKV